MNKRVVRACTWAVLALLVSSAAGCGLVLRPPVTAGMRITNDRFEVARLNKSALSPDQRKVLADSGTPKFIVFETQVRTHKAVQRWLYPEDKLQYVFLEGKKVDYVVVESAGINPLLEAAKSADQGPLVVAWQYIQLLGHSLGD
jgi:hypothetical protein